MTEKVILQFKLVRPYKKSVEILYDLVNIWGFELLSSGTDKEIAVIRIQVKDFRKIFGQEPKTGEYPVPAGTTTFITAVSVLKIEEIADGERSRPKPNKHLRRKKEQK